MGSLPTYDGSHTGTLLLFGLSRQRPLGSMALTGPHGHFSPHGSGLAGCRMAPRHKNGRSYVTPRETPHPANHIAPLQALSRTLLRRICEVGDGLHGKKHY